MSVVASSAVVALVNLANLSRLEESSLAAITRRVETLLGDTSVREIIFRGDHRTFLEGVEREFFAACIAEGDLARLMRFTARANELLARVARTPKRSVAWVEGVAAGGGLELALACREIAASDRARFCLPEVGLGILPGMGGTQRLSRRIGIGLAKWMIYTGSIVPAATAHRIGLIDRLLPITTSIDGVMERQIGARSPLPLDSPWSLLERFFSSHSLAELLDPQFPQPADPCLVRAWITVKQRPRLALEMAEQAIDQGYASTLSEGLAIESAKLPALFTAPHTLSLLRGEGK